jgi:hypothetical protein
MRRSLYLAVMFGVCARALAADTPALESAQSGAGDLIAAAKRSFTKAAAHPREPSKSVIPHFQQKRFQPRAGEACGLKSFTVVDYEIRSKEGGYDASRRTEMGAVIETTSPECIRDFGVVQFIRGCSYLVDYSAETGGELDRSFNNREFRGSQIVFNHPVYEVDQTQIDPLFTSYPEQPDRLALAYVPKSPVRLSSEVSSLRANLPFFDESSRRTFLKDAPGPTSVTFVTDLPDGGLSSISQDRKRFTAHNSSLEFETCVYRLRDVPTSGDPAGEDVSPGNGGPIQCFQWNSRYTYDAAARDFVTDRFSGVDPYCAQAPARNSR